MRQGGKRHTVRPTRDRSTLSCSDGRVPLVCASDGACWVFWAEAWGRGEELAGAYVGDARGPDQAERLGRVRKTGRRQGGHTEWYLGQTSWEAFGGERRPWGTVKKGAS